jgi:hypothetical protein
MSLGPLQSNVYADGILSNVSIAYQNAQYISDTVFPEVQVKDRTGIYFKYGKDKFTAVNDVRAPGTYAQVVNYTLTQSTYGPLLDHSLDARIEDEVASMAVSPLDPAFDATEMLTQRLLVSKEIDAVSQVTNTAVVTQNVTLSGTDRWDDYANSDPIGDVQTGIDAINLATSAAPSEMTVVMGYPVYVALRNHPQIIERIKHSQLGILDEGLLAQVFGVKRVIVGSATKNTANAGATASMSYAWGKNVWVMLIAGKPGPRTVSFGYTLRKGSRQVLRMRDDRAETEFVRVKDYYQQHIMASDAGYYLATVVN